MKELFTEPEITNKEYNKICNRYKNTAQTDIQCRRAIRRTIQTDQEVKAIQQLGIVAARATKEIAGLKGVQKNMTGKRKFIAEKNNEINNILKNSQKAKSHIKNLRKQRKKFMEVQTN